MELQMNKIVAEYDLVEGFPEEVTTKVNNRLNKDWELSGGPFLRKTKDGNEVVVQCMIRYERDFAGKYVTND
jgi:hypothetical protein